MTRAFQRDSTAKMRFVRGLALALPLLAAAACADMKAMFALSRALSDRYHLDAHIDLLNESHLTVTFTNVPPKMVSTDSGDEAAFAREAAGFVEAHYPNAAALEDITIQFAEVKDYGPVTVTHSNMPYTFRVAALAADTTSAHVPPIHPPPSSSRETRETR